MRSNRLEVEAMLDAVIPVRLKESGKVIRDNIKASIAEQGLIDTTRMIEDIQYQPEEPVDEVRVGSTIDDPPYPFFLNNGFVHAAHKRSPEEDAEADGPQEPTVGPYRFMEKGTSNAEGDLRRIWREPIRGMPDAV